SDPKCRRRGGQSRVGVGQRRGDSEVAQRRLKQSEHQLGSVLHLSSRRIQRCTWRLMALNDCLASWVQERESPCHAARCHVQKNLLTSGASYKSGPSKG